LVSDTTIIQRTRCWVKSVVIDLNFCPFAKHELEAGRVHFQVSHDVDLEQALLCLVAECQRLDESPEIETTLLVYTEAFNRFDDYLELLAMANDLLVSLGYEGTYQLASFHPEYCFAGDNQQSAANFTNRSPYPVLHLIRESSLERVLANYPEPESIPQRNIKVAQEKGLEQMQNILDKCMVSRE
jgi:hypothetical protein